MPLWVIPALVAMAIGTVWLRLRIVRTTYSINQSERKARELRQEREEMELKVTALRSPRRLELLARSKFGLGTPRADQVVHLGSRSGEGSQ
jgi:cell division protein FtsL